MVHYGVAICKLCHLDDNVIYLFFAHSIWQLLMTQVIRNGIGVQMVARAEGTVHSAMSHRDILGCLCVRLDNTPMAPFIDANYTTKSASRLIISAIQGSKLRIKGRLWVRIHAPNEPPWLGCWMLACPAFHWKQRENPSEIGM